MGYSLLVVPTGIGGLYRQVPVVQSAELARLLLSILILPGRRCCLGVSALAGSVASWVIVASWGCWGACWVGALVNAKAVLVFRSRSPAADVTAAMVSSAVRASSVRMRSSSKKKASPNGEAFRLLL